jgi:hypothetical protein
MKNQNTSAQRESVLKSMRLAEFRDILNTTDAEDMESCVTDLVKNAGLSLSEAKVVANSYRSKVLPRIASEMGLSDEDAEKVIGLHGGATKTTDFAKDKNTDDENDDKDGILPSEESIEDEIAEHGHIPSEEEEALEGETPEMHSPEVEQAINESEELEEDLNTDLSEVTEDEGNTALIQIEIPADEIDAVQRLLDEHFGGVSAEDNDDEILPVKEEALPLDEAELAVEAPANPLEIQDKVEPMDAKQLLARKQERAAILAGVNTRTVIAEDETKPRDIGLGKDTSAGGKAFQHAGDAQYIGEDKRPTTTKQNSEGNSLKEDNPTFSKQPIPTNNPENLQLKSGYEVVKKDGNSDGSLEYSVDFNQLDNIPSESPDRIDNYSVPTQMDNVVTPRKTTVAERIVECSGCNNPSTKMVNKAECQDCKTVIAICEDCETEGYCPVCASVATVKNVVADTEITIESAQDCEKSKDEKENGDGFTRKPHEDDESSRKANTLYKARLKTAYSVSCQLALANVIEPKDVDANADMWMADNLSPATMIAQGKLMLKSASSAAERVASSYSENRNVRHSNISLNPGAFNNAATQNSAPHDLKEALQGLFMTKFD